MMGSVVDKRARQNLCRQYADRDEHLDGPGLGASEHPPPYQEFEELPGMPALDLMDAHLSDTRDTVSREQVVAHLKFLAVLADLRDLISNSDGLFGLYDSEADNDPQKNEACARIREKRWAVYTARAVGRYEIYWTTCIPQSRDPITLRDLEDPDYPSIVDGNHSLRWTKDNLPPLGKPLIGTEASPS